MSDYFCVGPYSMLSRVDNVRSTAALATGLLNNNSFCNKAADKGDDEQLLLTTTDCHHQHHKYHPWCHGSGKFSCCAWVLRPSRLLISPVPGGGLKASGWRLWSELCGALGHVSVGLSTASGLCRLYLPPFGSAGLGSQPCGVGSASTSFELARGCLRAKVGTKV